MTLYIHYLYPLSIYLSFILLLLSLSLSLPFQFALSLARDLYTKVATSSSHFLFN